MLDVKTIGGDDTTAIKSERGVTHCLTPQERVVESDSMLSLSRGGHTYFWKLRDRLKSMPVSFGGDYGASFLEIIIHIASQSNDTALSL